MENFVMFLKNKLPNPTVSYATSCYEKDWRYILGQPDYLKVKQIENNQYNFAKKVLIINNVFDYEEVLRAAEKKIKEGVLTDVYIAKDYEQQALDFFNLKKEDFKAYKENKDQWVFYNATGVLTAIYLCKTDYLLFHTGDCYLDEPVNWIGAAIELMERKNKYKVANLCWNNNFEEVEKESYKRTKKFYVSKSGFSDQQFLFKSEDFKRPIYNEIRKDSHHFPWGDTFEKRVFSFMKNHRWKRITYRYGHYIHKDILPDANHKQ